MDVLHRLARSLGLVAAVIGFAGGLVSLGCGPEEPERPTPDAGFWDEGRAEAATVVAMRIDPSDANVTTPIAEGDELTLEFGPQGGSHVEIEVVGEGVDPETTRLGARLQRPDGTIVAEAFQPDYWGEPGEYRQRVFVQNFDDVGGPLLLRVRLRDASGAQATTEIGVTVR